MNAMAMFRELQKLVGRVNEACEQHTDRRGGYFCYTINGVPELTVKVGDTHDRGIECKYSAEKVAARLAGLDGEHRVRELTAAAIRTSNGSVLAFSGYHVEWNEALLYALAVNIGWMEAPWAMANIAEDARPRLQQLLAA